MLARVLLCIYQHRQFEVPSFTDSKYVITDWGENLKKMKGHVTQPRPLGGTLSSHAGMTLNMAHIKC